MVGSYKDGGDIELDDVDDENNEYKQTEVREAICFLIEITPDLLKPSNEIVDNESKLYEILSSINDLMQHLIKTSRNTGFGLYFYNCQANKVLKSHLKPVGFVELFHLNPLNLKYMKRLNDLIQDAHDKIRPLQEIFKLAPMEKDTDLVLILNKMIDELMAKKEFNRRRLIWMTTNDKPYEKKSTKEALWRVIDDYYAYGFFIEPFFINPSPHKEFDFHAYKDLFMNTNFLKSGKTKSTSQFAQSNQEEELDIGFSKDSLVFKKSILGNQIRANIIGIKNVRRILFTCNLILSDGGTVGGRLGCTVKGYQLYGHERIRKRELLLYPRTSTMERVYTETKLVRDGTSGELEPIEFKRDLGMSMADKKEDAGIRKGYPLGAGQDILLLNKEQMGFLRNYTFDHKMEDTEREQEEEEEEEEEDSEKEGGKNSISSYFSQVPYLQLIGFRDLRHFNPTYSCGAASFLTVDITGVSNSTIKGTFTNSFTTFASLYRSCLKLQKYIIVFGCIRENSRPHLYAMYPTQVGMSTKYSNEDDSENNSNFPQGFLLIRLPWIEDVRALPADYIRNVQSNQEPSTMVDSGLVKLMRELVETHKVPYYNPREYPNPSLNYFFDVIKHQLLEIPYPPTERSLTKHDITIQKLAYLKDNLSNKSLQLISDINREIRVLTERAAKRELEEDNAIDVAAMSALAKKPKFVVELSDQDILVAWRNSSLDRFTMDQLKSFRKRYPEINSAVRKREMIDNICTFLEANMGRRGHTD
ncbi:KU70 [Candida oxycetoniae]|uniref:DNA helicase n=1 Tax=Candida oxycetoniae TaxID=497107 RepID=A0AAI9T1V3_9ASCO|nr:KU70 [Candida oxycetoniae]KAI3407129.2 KU70 [Candida oxycetoniae]